MADVVAGAPVTPFAQLPPFDWRAPRTRFVLFTGRGGVGKTTIAAATAVALADGGRRVLLVSTDPASNLGDVFRTAVGADPREVDGVPGLAVMDLDPLEAAARYRARVTAPYRDVLPAEELAALDEQLAGACTVEVAAFETFSRLLAEPDLTSRYDHVLLDTAPTGHTLRLLGLPAAWSTYLTANPDAATCLGPLAGLRDEQATFARAVATLGDAGATTIVLVARPDRGALDVAAAAAEELHELGIDHLSLVVNGLLIEPRPGDAVAAGFAGAQRRALRAIPAAIVHLPTSSVPLVGIDVVGVDALRRLASGRADPPPDAGDAVAAGSPAQPDDPAGITELVDELARPRRGVILVTGKGGVGKTTIAGAIATELARRGHPVHLATTDPAGHAAGVVPGLPGLTTGAIDADAATDEYVRDRLAGAAASGLDQDHLDLLAEDLRSPCSQEVAVFREFRQLLGRARRGFVVVDTAPTGHTLLLLDATGAFHRQVVAELGQQLRVVTPLMRLQDPDYSRVVIVTLAETTPIAEAAELQADLRRAGIEPFGWVVNATLVGAGTSDPVLRARAAAEQQRLADVDALAPRVWTVPWCPATAGGGDAPRVDGARPSARLGAEAGSAPVGIIPPGV